MKTMKNFAAQQLTKNQMNEVCGGGNYAYNIDCTYTDPNGIQRHAFGHGSTDLGAVNDMYANIFQGTSSKLDCTWG